MYRRTKRVTYHRTLTDSLLLALTARPATALADFLTVLLWNDGPPFTPDYNFGDYPSTSFHGYMQVVPTLSVPVNSSSNDQLVIASAVFVATAGGAINATVNGYQVIGGVDFNVPVCIERFDWPVSFGAPGDFLELDLLLPLPMIYLPSVS